MRITLDDEDIGLPCTIAADESADDGGQLKVSRDVLALVLPLIAPLIFLEDIWTMARAFPLYGDMIGEVAAKTFRHLTVGACDRFIAPMPPLNFAKHVCRCHAKQQFEPLLDASKFPHLRTLIAIRTWAHPILSNSMNELASFKSLARLYITPTKGSAQSSWWYSLPLTLTDLCIFFNARMPCDLRLNHLVNVTNCLIGANTMGSASLGFNRALSYLPPNLSSFKVSRHANDGTRGHLSGDVLPVLPQSITWLECDSLEGELRHLPKSLLHLKSSISLELKATVVADGACSSTEAYIAHYAPPNWKSFATDSNAVCDLRLTFTSPNNNVGQPLRISLIQLPMLNDFQIHSLPVNGHGTKYIHNELPHIKVWRWLIDTRYHEKLDSFFSIVPNLLYMDTKVDLFATYSPTLSPFTHLRYLHLLCNSHTECDLSKVSLPDSLIHVTLCVCDNYEGKLPISSRLETMNVVVHSRRMRALKFQNAAPASLRGIDFCIYHGSSTDTFDSFVKRVTGLVRTCMSTYRTLDDDQRLVPFTISARQAGSAVVSSMMELSRGMAHRNAGLVDYSSAWGWQMDRIDRLRL